MNSAPKTVFKSLLCLLALSAAAHAATDGLFPGSVKLSHQQAALLMDNRYQVHSDGIVMGPDGKTQIAASELPDILTRLQSFQRLKAMLRIGIILSNSSGGSRLSVEEKQEIRNISRGNWAYLRFNERRKLKKYFTLQELDDLDRIPLPQDDSGEAVDLPLPPQPTEDSAAVATVSAEPAAVESAPIQHAAPKLALEVAPGSPAPSAPLQLNETVAQVQNSLEETSRQVQAQAASGANANDLSAILSATQQALQAAALLAKVASTLAAQASLPRPPAQTTLTPIVAPSAPAAAKPIEPPPASVQQTGTASTAKTAAVTPVLVAQPAPASTTQTSAAANPAPIVVMHASSPQTASAILAAPAAAIAAAGSIASVAPAAASAQSAAFQAAESALKTSIGAGLLPVPTPAAAPAGKPAPPKEEKTAAPKPPAVYAPLAAATEPPEVSQQDFDKFLAGAPYLRETKDLLQMIYDKGPNVARSRALRAVMADFPQIFYDRNLAGSSARAALIAHRFDGKSLSYVIALSPGPSVFTRKRFLLGSQTILLPAASEVYASLPLAAPDVQAIKSGSVAVKEAPGPWGQTRFFEDESQEGTYSQAEQAGTLLYELLLLDAQIAGAEPSYVVERYARSAEWMLFAKIETERKRDDFLDPAILEWYRLWRDHPDEYDDDLIHHLSAGRQHEFNAPFRSQGQEDEFNRQAFSQCPKSLSDQNQEAAAQKVRALEGDIGFFLDAGLADKKAAKSALAKAAQDGSAGSSQDQDAAQDCGTFWNGRGSGLNQVNALSGRMNEVEDEFRELQGQHEKAKP